MSSKFPDKKLRSQDSSPFKTSAEPEPPAAHCCLQGLFNQAYVPCTGSQVVASSFPCGYNLRPEEPSTETAQNPGKLARTPSSVLCSKGRDPIPIQPSPLSWPQLFCHPGVLSSPLSHGYTDEASEELDLRKEAMGL